MSNGVGWEKAVLGTALYDPETMELAEDLLPADFTHYHQDLWAEMLTLHREGALEQRALVESLRQRDVLDTIGENGARGEEYLAELLVYRGGAMEEYVKHVLSASNKRQLAQVAAMIRADAEDENIDDQEAFDHAEQRLLGLRRNRSIEMGTPLSSLLGVFQDRVTAFRDGSLEPAWVPEMEAIRWVIRYIDADDFVVLGSRPGEGKSSIMRYLFAQAAMAREPVLLFNLENGELEYAKFALSLYTGIDSAKLKEPSLLLEEELELLREAARQLANAPLYVKTIGAPTVQEIDRIARQHISRHGVKRIGVDYIQLIRNRVDNRVQDVSMSSGVLRAMALNYQVPVMANAQLSRDIVRRGENATPTLADLRESGSLEQDATMVWMPRLLWPVPTGDQLRMFPDNLGSNGELREVTRAVPIKIHVLKNRNGPIGETMPILWRKHVNDFNTITEFQG